MSVLNRDDIRHIGEIVAKAVLEALEEHAKRKSDREFRECQNIHKLYRQNKLAGDTYTRDVAASYAAHCGHYTVRYGDDVCEPGAVIMVDKDLDPL